MYFRLICFIPKEAKQIKSEHKKTENVGAMNVAHNIKMRSELYYTDCFESQGSDAINMPTS